MINKPPKNLPSNRMDELDESRLRDIARRIEVHPALPRYLDNPDFRATKRRPDQFTPSAVLIPVIKRPELSLLFTHRADHLLNHAGEISFPGGKFDLNDSSLTTTALRETEEELGLTIEHIDILTQLPTLRVLSGFAITPVLGLVNPPLTIQLNENEVKGVFEAPLHYCLDAMNFNFTQAHHHGEERAFFSLDWQEWTIWGATAAILHGLSQLITQVVDSN